MATSACAKSHLSWFSPEVLFELPATLQKCLDRKAYGEAVEAYCGQSARSNFWKFGWHVITPLVCASSSP